DGIFHQIDLIDGPPLAPPQTVVAGDLLELGVPERRAAAYLLVRLAPMKGHVRRIAMSGHVRQVADDDLLFELAPAANWNMRDRGDLGRDANMVRHLTGMIDIPD